MPLGTSQYEKRGIAINVPKARHDTNRTEWQPCKEGKGKPLVERKSTESKLVLGMA